MKRLTFLMFLMLVSVCFVSAEEPIGVFANSNTNSIQFIDPLTMETSVNYLGGELGSYGGGLFDMVITPDGKTAIVSNFGDSRIFCIDISGGFNTRPVLKCSIRLPFFAEDIAITKDGKYAVVTDGGFSNRAAVIGFYNGHCYLLKSNNLGANKYANAVDIIWCDNIQQYCVVFADYFQGKVHAYTMQDDGEGTLVFNKSVHILPCRPVNVAISPDAKTVIAVDAGGPFCVALSFDNQCVMYKSKIVQMPFRSGQSCVFNKAGDKAYYLSNSRLGGTQVVVLNVNGPGDVSVSGTNIKVTPTRGTSQLFGVDTIALDPSEQSLYVTNPTLSGGKGRVSVLDLNVNAQVDYLDAKGIPVGIAFATIEE